MGACTSTSQPPVSNSESKVSPWEIMVQSHQGLYAALDHLKQSTMTKKRNEMAEIRKEADRLFLLMKLHARIEDVVYFPAFNEYRPNVASTFSDDHKKSGEGRPKLLALLDNASSSDAAFEEGMAALQKFCDGNRNHQQREEEVLDPFKPLFPFGKVKDLFARLAALDAESFNTTYVDGIYSHLPVAGREKFLAALELCVPASQYAEIQNTIRKTGTTANSAFQAPTANADPWQIMVQSHQGLFAALDHLKQTTMTLKRESMDTIRKEANALFLMMKLHARLEDTVYFPAFNALKENVAESFSDDHKKSAEGRPKLLELLDNAVNSDEAFEEGMAALRKFCDGNRNHQQREEEVLDPLKPQFERSAVKDLFARLAALDEESFNVTYCNGIYSHLPPNGREQFLSALQYCVPASQYAEIMKNIQK